MLGGKRASTEGSFHLYDGERSGSGAATGFERRLAEKLLARVAHPNLELVLWGGETVGPASGVTASVRIHDRATFWRLLLRPDLEFGNAYSSGRLEVEGELIDAIAPVYLAPRPQGLFRLLAALHRPRRALNTRSRSRHNVHEHYDLGNDFYSLWLDRELLYTCAYYPSAETTLEQAQRAKMELVCRKLRLRAGQRVVEAGSGWGALALYMAREHGVHVTSYNLSEQQVAYARERAHAEGVAEDRVRFELADYRDIEGEFDAFVSVGMLEHVGVHQYRALGALIAGCLRPGGLALLHTIGRNRPQPLNAWIRRRIFPGAEPPSLGQMNDIWEPNDLSVIDVENLRLHYARTLRDWLERYSASESVVRGMFDEEFVRAWRLYLAGSVAAFETGSLQLFQVVLGRADSNHVPMTRADLYDESTDRRTVWGAEHAVPEGGRPEASRGGAAGT